MVRNFPLEYSYLPLISIRPSTGTLTPRSMIWTRELTFENHLKDLTDVSRPKVTTLYGLKVPGGEPQTIRYDDGTGDELKVPLGTTACESIYESNRATPYPFQSSLALLCSIFCLVNCSP